MEWNIKFIRSDNYIKITPVGVFSFNSHHKLLQNLLTFKYWKPGAPLFFDNRKFDFGSVTTDKLRAASDIYQKISNQLGNGKVAFLMKSALDFGFGRQFEMLSDGKGELQICVFLDEKAALHWLLSKEASKDSFSYSH